MASQDVCDEILAGYFPHIDDEYAAYIKGTQTAGMIVVYFIPFKNLAVVNTVKLTVADKHLWAVETV